MASNKNAKALARLVFKSKSLILSKSKKGEILKDAGKEELKVIERSFKNEKSPSGEPWKPLDFNYRKWKSKKFGSKKILDLTGDLQKSFYSRVNGTSVRVGSTSDVAIMHQEGLNGLSSRKFMGVDKEFRANTDKNIRARYGWGKK